jgi:hypothetical protein
MTTAAPGRIGRITKIDGNLARVNWIYQLQYRMHRDKFIAVPIKAYVTRSTVAINHLVKLAPQNLDWAELEYIKYNTV